MINKSRKGRRCPCYQCTEKRAELGLGCHGKCEDYIEWRSRRNEMLKALYNERAEMEAVVKSNKNRVRHMSHDNTIVAASRRRKIDKVK